MKISGLIILLFFTFHAIAQRPKAGTYTFKYCDAEFENTCVYNVKVIVRKDSVFVFASKELAAHRTFTTENELINSGLLLQHKTGKWIVAQSRKDKNAPQLIVEGPAVLDFKEKKYWTF